MDEENKQSKRETTILVMKRLELLDAEEDGVNLNEGYAYDVNAPIAEVADGIAKMAIQLDEMLADQPHTGAYFIELIKQFYEREVGEHNEAK